MSIICLLRIYSSERNSSIVYLCVSNVKLESCWKNNYSTLNFKIWQMVFLSWDLFHQDQLFCKNQSTQLSLNLMHLLIFSVKVQLFWGDNKNVRNRPYGFKIYLVNVKTIRTIAQIFVAFSEKLNFTDVPACCGKHKLQMFCLQIWCLESCYDNWWWNWDFNFTLLLFFLRHQHICVYVFTWNSVWSKNCIQLFAEYLFTYLFTNFRISERFY